MIKEFGKVKGKWISLSSIYFYDLRNLKCFQKRGQERIEILWDTSSIIRVK